MIPSCLRNAMRLLEEGRAFVAIFPLEDEEGVVVSCSVERMDQLPLEHQREYLSPFTPVGIKTAYLLGGVRHLRESSGERV